MDKAMISYELEWFNRNEEDDQFIVGNVELPEVTESDLREIFGLSDDEHVGCLEVDESHIDWLKTKIAIEIDLVKFEYFVSPYSE